MKDAWFFRIKAAQRDLIDRAGGIERAAAITSFSTSQVGRWRKSDDLNLMPTNAVMMLEAETGFAFVTQVMAEVNGRRLADEVGDAARNAVLLTSYSEAIRQAGELMSAGAQAFADGRVTPAEAQAIDRATSKLSRDLADLRHALAGVQATGGQATVIQFGAEGGARDV